MTAVVAHCTSVHPWEDTRIFLKMARYSVKAGRPVYLIGIDRNAREEQNFARDGVIIHLLPGTDIRNRADRLFKGAKRVVDHAVRVHPTIVHFHDPEMIPFVASAKFNRASIIFDAHEDVPALVYSRGWIPGPAKPLFKLAAQGLERLASSRFDAVIGATPAITERFPEKGVTIQNFPISGELATATVDADQWESRPNRGIYVGGMSTARGILPLIRGIGKSKLIEGFDLVGAPDTSLPERELMKTPGIEKVTRHGQQPRSALPGLLAQARFGVVTFLAHPNHVNAQPNKLFEYMSAGLPVLTSDFPLWREIVGALGEYVDPEDSDAIGEGIDKLLSADTETQFTRSEAAARRIAEHFTWERESSKLEALYERLQPTQPRRWLEVKPIPG